MLAFGCDFFLAAGDLAGASDFFGGIFVDLAGAMIAAAMEVLAYTILNRGCSG